nr:hybrid signal transduction histidine kinase M [Tanacetum cinerariifolium]
MRLCGAGGRGKGGDNVSSGRRCRLSNVFRSSAFRGCVKREISVGCSMVIQFASLLCDALSSLAMTSAVPCSRFPYGLLLHSYVALRGSSNGLSRVILYFRSKKNQDVVHELIQEIRKDDGEEASCGRTSCIYRGEEDQSFSIRSSSESKMTCTKRKAWDVLAEIFGDNKRSCSIALKAKLHSLKLGDLSIDAYFRKIESIATILASLSSPLSKDDIVNIVLEGFPDKYKNVSGIIIHREPFSDVKMVRSMLIKAEMLLKSMAQATSVDSTSSSPMVLLDNSGNNTRHTNVIRGKLNNPYFNFARGFCRFGDISRYMHGGLTNRVNGNNSLWLSSNTRLTPNMTPEQMVALIQQQQNMLAQFRYIGNTNSTACLYWER